MRITRLVDMLLQMTMLNAQTNFPLMITSIDDLLRDAVSHAQSPNLTIICEIDEVLPPLHINPEMITKALRELIDNAKHHTPHGGRITIGARTHQQYVAITVQDSGNGIHPDQLPRYFLKTILAC